MIIYDDESLNEFLGEKKLIDMSEDELKEECLVRAYYNDKQGNIKLSQPFEAKNGIVKAEDIKKYTSKEYNKSEDELKEECTVRFRDNFGGIDFIKQKQPRFGDNIVIVKGKKYKRMVICGDKLEDDACYDRGILSYYLNHVIYKGEHIDV